MMTRNAESFMQMLGMSHRKKQRFAVPSIASLVLCVLGCTSLHAEYVRGEVRNDPNFRENAPAAVFPNTSIPPRYPEAKPQTHGLDLSQRTREVAQAYFKWLCDNEAGEFIYKTVDNVDSVFEMRRRITFDYDFRSRDRYYFEDPWGVLPWANSDQILTDPSFFVLPSSYRPVKGWAERGDYFRYEAESAFPVLERTATPLENKRYGPGRFIRYTRVWPSHPEYDRDAQGNIRMFQLRQYLNAPPRETRTNPFWLEKTSTSPDRQKYEDGMRAVGIIPAQVEASNQIQSRYGFTWRGIERNPNDRELGIGGGEVLVFDLHTNEVLAVRRNFRFSYPTSAAHNREVSWSTGVQCVQFDSTRLVKKVLKPSDPYSHISVPSNPSTQAR